MVPYESWNLMKDWQMLSSSFQLSTSSHHNLEMITTHDPSVGSKFLLKYIQSTDYGWPSMPEITAKLSGC